MKTYLLGIDIGTSACKIVLFTAEGEVVAQNSKSYPTYYPEAGWVEQNPMDWWEAVCSSIREMITENQIDTSKIAGIGIDGQSWSAIAMDNEGNVLCNTPIWMDTRAEKLCQKWNEQIGHDEIFAIAGNRLEPSYTLPKILWYQENRPDVYKKAVKILQSNSFIGFQLTGNMTQEVSQGYGLQCFNIRSATWDTDLCKLLGLDTALLPDIVACHQVIGTVHAAAAKQTGLMEGIPVVAGGLDAACGTLGAGVIHEGETQEQGGQAGGMSICMDECLMNKHLILSQHVVPNRWLLQGGTVGGGGVLRWFEKEFGASERELAKQNGCNSFEEMSKAAETIMPGSDGLFFLPYMSGERSPIWDTKAKGLYYGIDFSKTRAHFIRASMEGVSYSLLHNIEIAKQAGATISVLRAMGGAANSDVWTQMKADMTGKKIIVPSSDTATTLGAVILAGVGTGIYNSFDEAIEKTVVIKREYIPNMENHEFYQKEYQTYLELYQQLKCIMHR